MAVHQRILTKKKPLKTRFLFRFFIPSIMDGQKKKESIT